MAALRAGLPVKNHTFSACDARARRSWRGYRGGLCHVSLPPNFFGSDQQFRRYTKAIENLWENAPTERKY